MAQKFSTLMMGASYGSLCGIKMLMAGHDIRFVCLPAEADLINREGIVVRLPVRGRDGLIELRSKEFPGNLAAAGPDDVDPSEYDLVGLAMQEPQYRSDGVRQLLDRVAKSGKPCMSIMNMPPLPYLARIPGLDTATLDDCYTDASVWQNFDPDLVTLASPDPQGFRPPDEPVNVLQVGLPTNFKVARFVDDGHTAILKQIQTDIEAIRYDPGDGEIELPVKLKVHDSIFVPLAKWCMLVTGNYRCVLENEAQSIRDAVHSDLEQSRRIYDWVVDVCVELGADPADMVPFDKYAEAAKGLLKPSSAARALFAGAPNIERVDRVVRRIARQQGKEWDVIDAIIERVDARLELNRKAA